MALKSILVAALVLRISANAQLEWHEEQPLQASITPCGLLADTFPGQVSMPHEKAYSQSQDSYWTAQQQDLSPACRFYPKGARDIQEALADILIPLNVSIAVVSGGHSSNIGASNVDEGITIDLANLSKIKVMEEEGAVIVGPAAHWGDVYSKLHPLGLTVSGGRAANVGVGGYVLGGGFSWFANQYGWTCDSALEFEVVTPQGNILYANAHMNDDIFWALKGSLGAFGIVTKIRLPTILDRNVYGGALSYESQHAPSLFKALRNLALSADQSPAQSGYLTFAWVQATDSFQYTTYLMNTKDDSTNQALLAFKDIPSIESTLRTTTIEISAEEIAKSNPAGLRRSKFTLTAQCNVEAMESVHGLVKSFSAKMTFDTQGVLGVTYQPLTVPHLKAQNNIFELNAADGPLLLISVELWWSEKNRDEYFEGSTKHLRQAMETELAKISALHGWIYPNYAAKDQTPFAAPESLNAVTKRMLEAIKRRYDPDRLWDKLVPEIWHI